MSVEAPGNDQFTKLLFHFDAPNGSTTFKDFSASNHAATPSGNAQVSTAQAFFGGSSLLCDGTGDYLTLADSADWVFGTNPFAIDFRLRPLAVGGGSAHTLLWQGPNTNNFIHFFIETDGSVGFRAVSAGAAIGAYGTNTILSINTWRQIAYVRSGTTFLILFDGISQALTTFTAIGSNSLPDYAAELRVGDNTVVPQGYNGYFDELRISQGTDRGWTAAGFTPSPCSYG